MHTKRRNRLHQKKLNDLVFVMYNMRLKKKQQLKQLAQMQQKAQQTYSLDSIPSDDEWITEDDPLLSMDEDWLNVLRRASDDEDVDVAVLGSNEMENVDDLDTNSMPNDMVLEEDDIESENEDNIDGNCGYEFYD